jgi:hypothetical protein
MTTRLSQFNNTGLPLGTGLTFTGNFERTLTGLEISTFVNSSGLCLVTIEQSIDASNVRITTTFNYDPVNDVSTFSVPVALPFFRVKLFNGDIVAQAYLSLNTYVINTPPQQVIIAGGTADVVVTGVVDVSGSVVASNLITETLATRRVDFLVVGDYYRVASVGITTGAQWNQIGAIVNGESSPVIGRLFKCLAIGPAVAGGGECYDVEYTDTVSLANATVVRVADYYGSPITTTAGNLNINLNAISTATALHTIVDSVIQDLSCNILNFPAVQDVSGTFWQATQPVSVAQDLSCNVLNFPATQAVSGTFYPAVQDVSGTFWQATQPVSIATLPSLATGTNSIGAISDITNTVTTKISNSIYTNARVLDLSITGHVVKASAGTLRGISCSNHDNTLYAYVKIYDKATAPTSADTPICTLPIVKNQTETYDFFSLQMNNGISIRASGGIADNDNTGISNCTVFVSYDGA